MIRRPARTFEDLVVWQKAHKFVLATYSISGSFPKQELFGITSQIRRASVSIAANIAEGFKKRGIADKLRYLNISQGSTEEVRYYLRLIYDLGYVNSTGLVEQLEEVSKLLHGYLRSIANSEC